MMSESDRDFYEWVPRVGLLEVPASSAALIRGLFGLAAWVADHPELPLPSVTARHYPPRAAEWDTQRAVVDAFGAALNVRPRFTADRSRYAAARFFGPVDMACSAIASTQEQGQGPGSTRPDGVR